MDERNSHETPNIYPNLHDQQQFREVKLMKLNIILLLRLKKEQRAKDSVNILLLLSILINYFIINCLKPLIVLSVTTGSISTVSFATVIVPPVGIASVIFSLAFSISTGIVKTMKNKKK